MIKLSPPTIWKNKSWYVYSQISDQLMLVVLLIMQSQDSDLDLVELNCVLLFSVKLFFLWSNKCTWLNVYTKINYFRVTTTCTSSITSQRYITHALRLHHHVLLIIVGVSGHGSKLLHVLLKVHSFSGL